jgi:hypothetical protein
MKIQLHFSISFHFKNNYRESICDPYYKNEKFIAQKNCKNLNQKIIMNFSLILFVFYFQMFVLFYFIFFVGLMQVRTCCNGVILGNKMYYFCTFCIILGVFFF